MIYQITTRNGAETVRTFSTWGEYGAAQTSPRGSTTVFSVPAFIPGRSYQERKHATRNALQRAEKILSTPGLAWADLAAIQAEAERIARRAGLINEARENGIV